jgi:flagellar FliJ protein
MGAADDDRGMKAVARARSVRERDSRIGLQHALLERNAHRNRLDQYEQRISAVTSWQGGDSSTYLAKRQMALALGEAAREEAVLLDSAQQVADAAHAHWSQDKIRLSAVESLLERRAAERRTERARREAIELDDIASQLWIRARRSTSDSPNPTPSGEVPHEHR